MSWREIVSKNQLSIKERNLRDILELKRFDSEYFQPEYDILDSIISSKSSLPISDFAEISDGNHLAITNHFTTDTDSVPYFRGQDINNFFIGAAKPLRITHDAYLASGMKRSHFLPNDILLSIVGTVGSLSLVTDDLGKATGSCKIAILRPRNPMYAKTISVFLASKYGQYQLKRMTRGAVQQGIILEDIPNIIVPDFDDILVKSVDAAVAEAIDLDLRARSLQQEAEDTLLRYINLQEYMPSQEGIAIKSLSESLLVNRIDAEYWQPKYEEVEAITSTVKQLPLGEIADLEKGVEPGSENYSDTGVPFVRVSDVSTFGVESLVKCIPETLYDLFKDKHEPVRDEVIFTKDGTIGISFVWKSGDKTILSGAFLRLQPKIDINVDYLSLVLNSLYCKMQIERMSGGAIIKHLKPEDVKKIRIPILSSTQQDEISNLVTSALQLRTQARSKLNDAKDLIETWIEDK